MKIPMFDPKDIRQASYDASARTLGLVFASGEQRQHLGVPASIVVALGQDEAAGSFYNVCIKGVYAEKQGADFC